MNVYGFIFARGGSKGVPNKNIKPLCGKPLLAHTIETAFASGCLDRLIVSTDNEQIAEVARQYGAETPFLRPAHLATDDANEWLSWQHAVGFLKNRGDRFHTFISLPATAPLRSVDDIRRCLVAFQEKPCDLVLTYADAARSPYFNMLAVDDRQYARIAVPLKKTPYRRQDAPVVYDATPVAYVSSPEYVMSSSGLWDGKVLAVKVDRINALDIDMPIDFEMAELFLRKRKDG